MARPFVLGNGNILVDLDEHGRVRDFYYPYVGQENQVNGNIHHLGVFVDGAISWIGSGAWEKKLLYEKETLVTDIHMINHQMQIELHFSDVVCHDLNIFIRKVTVHNLADKDREVRLFFHQHFCLYESNIGDTVFYNPFIQSLVHYKGKRYFLINGMSYNEEGEQGFDQYTTGLTGEFGLAGTYVDAEDGTLAENPVEHGSVDSTIGFTCRVSGKSEKTIYYWVTVGKDLGEVSKLNGLVCKITPEALIESTRKKWQTWVNRTPFNFFKLNESVVDLFKRSLLIIQCHVDDHGSIIASSDSQMLFRRRDTYSYMWPRDGALIVRALDRAGYFELTQQFFSFCFKALTPFGYLFHKYNPDGSFGSTWHPWVHDGQPQLPIQEDEIGLVMDALWKQYQAIGDKHLFKAILDTFIKPITDFMLDFIDENTGLPKESYDLWEEKLGIHTFTCATVYAGFKAAARFEAEFGTTYRAKLCDEKAEQIKNGILQYLYDEDKGYFIKRLYYKNNEIKKDYTHDASSFYGVFQFEVLPVDDERILSSVQKFLKELKVDDISGGFVRYSNDQYMREQCTELGNPWFVTTLWLAEYYVAKAKTYTDFKPAIDIFEWVTKWAFSTGVLSEQLDPCSGKPISVAPLTWSHAGYVIAVIKYLEKLDDLGICDMCYPDLNGSQSNHKKEKG